MPKITSNKVTITVKNWDKYNPRKDQKSCSWLRLNHDLFADDKLFSLTLEEISCFIYVLCRCSSAATPSPTVDMSLTDRLHRVPKELLLRTLKKLSAIGAVTYTLRTRALRTDVTDDTNERDFVTEKKKPVTTDVELVNKVTLAVVELNQLTDSHFEADAVSTTKDLERIFAHGYTPADVSAVIKHRVNVWTNDPKMCNHLRPSTLFRFTNFQEYLGLAKSWVAAFDEVFGGPDGTVTN